MQHIREGEVARTEEKLLFNILERVEMSLQQDTKIILLMEHQNALLEELVMLHKLAPIPALRSQETTAENVNTEASVSKAPPAPIMPAPMSAAGQHGGANKNK